MAFRLHRAGILQYSKPLFEEIEEYLLRVYATMFIPSLRAEADRGDENLRRIQQQVEKMRELVEELRDDPSNPRAFATLMGHLMPLMLNGALAQFGIRPDRLEHHLQARNDRKIDKYLGRVDNLIDTLDREAKEGLGNQAKGMRKDIKEWEPHYDPEMEEHLEHLRRQGKSLELKIDLKADQFPFLGEKFQRHVREARGPEATMFDDIPSITVKIAQLPDNMMGAWEGQDHDLLVGVPAFAPFKSVKKSLNRTLSHELRHMTQTMMAKALGIKQVELGEDGLFVPVYNPSPGMGPRKTLKPDIVQALMHQGPSPEALANLPTEKREKLEERAEQFLAKRKELMQLHKLQSRRSIYNLDDLEFYTHLADRVLEFEDVLEQLPELTPVQKKTAFLLYTGGLQVPKDVRRFLERGPRALPDDRSQKAMAWLHKHDPKLAILPLANRPDEYFRHLRKYSRPKWEKAVKEFAKVLQPKLGTGEKPTGLQDLWKEFLDERYDGGKKKIRNPHLDTRDAHPEISVSYLMKQDGPDYKTDRMKIRREFAAWRQRKKGPPKGAPDLFTRPPS